MNVKIPYIQITPLQIIFSLSILIIGWLISKMIISLFKRSISKTRLPLILIEFLSRFLYSLLIILTLLLFVSTLGFSVGSILVSLSAILGLIFGFGFQDTLNNLGAGFWIALFRPFDKGDLVSVGEITGIVKTINIMATEFLTPDNTFIMVPNRTIWGAAITNYTRMEKRRVAINVGVAYGTDLNKAINIALETVKENKKVLDNPIPNVAVTELADSSVNLEIRAWVKTSDYLEAKSELIQKIYEKYMEKGIEIPFPQIDIHLKKE